MLRTAILEVTRLHWTQWRARQSLPCVLTIAIALAAGIAAGRPAVGMIAASGAMSVGFGAFQRLGRSRVAPMLWASIGMSVSAMGGSFVGHSGPGAMFNAFVAGFGGGLLLEVSPGAGWVGLQCGIAALVASGYPAGAGLAFSRALLILAGGLAQTGVVFLFWRLGAVGRVKVDADPYPGVAKMLSILRNILVHRDTAFRFSARRGLTLAVGAGIAHYAHLPNGYWAPMTALLVLRTDFQQTFHRGVARVVGTLAGAVLANALVVELRPGLVTVAALVALFAWLGYSLINVNYGVFAICLTSYIVFLLAVAGLPPHEVIAHRSLNTALGGALALLSYAYLLLPGKPKAAA
jgi:hypothetical protein